MFRHVRVAEIFQLKITKFYFHFRNVRSIFRSFSFVMHSIQWMEESENSTDQIKIRLLLLCELCIQLTQWKIQQHSDRSRKKYNVDFVLDCSPAGRWFHCEYFRFYLRHRFTWIENGVFNYTAVKIAKQLTKIFISGWIVIRYYSWSWKTFANDLHWICASACFHWWSWWNLKYARFYHEYQNLNQNTLKGVSLGNNGNTSNENTTVRRENVFVPEWIQPEEYRAVCQYLLDN